MAQWVGKRRPRRILEVGAGIGTTTAAITRSVEQTGLSDVLHVVTENIPFCRDELRKNLGSRFDSIRLVEWPSQAPAELYDLVAIDGLGPGAADDLWSEEHMERETICSVANLAPRAVVIVENLRLDQRATIEANARKPRVSAHVQPIDGSPGYHLYLLDPSPGERIVMTLRAAWSRVWIPRGAKALRRLYRKVTGRPMTRRSLGPIRDA